MKRGRDTPAMAPPPSVTKKGSVSLASTQERVAYSLVTQAVQEKYGRCTLELFCARHKATRKINPLALGYKRDLETYISADFWDCYQKASINPNKRKTNPKEALNWDVEFDYFAFFSPHESEAPIPDKTLDRILSVYTTLCDEDRLSPENDAREVVIFELSDGVDTIVQRTNTEHRE